MRTNIGVGIMRIKIMEQRKWRRCSRISIVFESVVVKFNLNNFDYLMNY